MRAGGRGGRGQDGKLCSATESSGKGGQGTDQKHVTPLVRKAGPMATALARATQVQFPALPQTSWVTLVFPCLSSPRVQWGGQPALLLGLGRVKVRALRHCKDTDVGKAPWPTARCAPPHRVGGLVSLTAGTPPAGPWPGFRTNEGPAFISVGGSSESRRLLCKPSLCLSLCLTVPCTPGKITRGGAHGAPSLDLPAPPHEMGVQLPP